MHEAVRVKILNATADVLAQLRGECIIQPPLGISRGGRSRAAAVDPTRVSTAATLTGVKPERASQPVLHELSSAWEMRMHESCAVRGR